MSTLGHASLIVYVGTYTTGAYSTGASEGVYIYQLNVSSGAMDFVGKATGIENPTYVAVDPQNRFLYAANETECFRGNPGGSVSAFAIASQSGALTLLNQKPTHGAISCYVTVAQLGRFLLVANYGGGSVSILPIQQDGPLGDAVDVVRHRGRGPDASRQKGPHPHCVALDGSNGHALVADLGLDRVMVYPFDRNRGRFDRRNVTSVRTAAGAGPRHLAFHPSGTYVYLVNELHSTLTAYLYDATNGSLEELQTVSTLPDTFGGDNWAADVRVSPSGRFVYASNRGHDSIAIFTVEESTGRPILIGHEPTQGKFPRGFAIDPTGTWLLAANQKSNSVISFRINQQTGGLVPTKHRVSVPTPTCLCIVPLPGNAQDSACGSETVRGPEVQSVGLQGKGLTRRDARKRGHPCLMC
jgi:6-phosphogluconolactonase